MEKKKSLKNDNRGASLLAVIMVLVVVTAIGVVITRVTITNIQMKEVERATKKNFYNAESVMDAVYAGAGEKASTAMGDAYQHVLENYVSIVNAGQNPQEVFSEKYLDGLQDQFGAVTGAAIETTDGSKVIFRQASYKVGNLKSCIDAAQQDLVTTTAGDAIYYADYKEGTYTLKNVQVKYKNDQDYEDTIKTDLVFSVPVMNFDDDRMSEFMKYSLIANKKIEINANATVGGSVYAGAEGIAGGDGTGGSPSTGTFTGKTILTRGDIATSGSSSLVLGNGSSSIWAENIETKRGGASHITVNGNCYVADDLTLNGCVKNGDVVTGSTVELNGSYYGYNFRKNYGTTTEPSVEAKYSSAMMINSRDSHLKMEGLNYLMLAGRTYLSRGEETLVPSGSAISDVTLGESLSVRPNQMAYYVPEKYLDTSVTPHTKITTDGAVEFKADTGIDLDAGGYLNAEKEVVPYYYIEKGTGNHKTNYYLNFANEEKANKFFMEYCQNKRISVSSRASEYAANDALILDSHTIYTLKGDVMCRDTVGGEFKEITIEPAVGGVSNWDNGNIYWNLSSQLAVKYKALQLSLSDSHPDATPDNVRITSGAAIDKTVSPMFTHLINETELNGLSGASTSEVRTLEDGTTYAVHYDETAGTYQISSTNFGADFLSANHQVLIAKGNVEVNVPFNGIIVAGGDVMVSTNDFKGLIISNGKIDFGSGAVIDSDEYLVSSLFKDDLKHSTKLFSQYFNDYNGVGTENNPISGLIDMKQYLTYDNWKKNV